MPSSGYIANSFVASEQPSTAKWNELWSNDASFNNGNGFNDAIIVARHMAISSVKTPNFKPTIVNSNFSVQGSAFTTTSASFVAITGMSFNYTAGTSNETLLLWWGFPNRSLSSAVQNQFALSVNGSAVVPYFEHDDSNGGSVAAGPTVLNVAANATVALGLMVNVGSGFTSTINTNNANTLPYIVGISTSNV